MRLKKTNNESLKLSTTTNLAVATTSPTIKMASSLLVDGGNGNNNNNGNGGSGSGGGGGGGGGGGVTSSSNSTNAVGSGNSNSSNITSQNDDNKSGKFSMNNNNAEDAQIQNDNADIRLKRQTLAQRKLELEMLLDEKSWMLQQIQKHEAQIINGNHDYVNLNEILTNLKKQYRQEQQQHQKQHTFQNHSTGSTAILRRKTATGAMGMSSSSSKENQNILNNNNNNNNSNISNINRKSEVSNRSSEYDNYPVSSSVNSGAVTSSSCGNLTIDTNSTINFNMLPQQQQQQQILMKQTINAGKKRTTSTSGATNYGSYLQQIQQQQQQQQQLANDQLYLQQYLAEQNYLQQKISSYQQRQQQQQQQNLQQQQLQCDVISLYSVNSANVATLRHQHVAPQQQPQQSTIVQCDKYYLSPTHQSHSNASGCSFIKSSQNIKKYNSPAASPTTGSGTGTGMGTGTASNTNFGGMSNLGSTMTLGGFNYDLQHGILPTAGSSATMPQQHTLQHYHHNVSATMPAAHQLDAISLAPSYAASMDAGIVGSIGNGGIGGLNTIGQHHNIRWRSHTNIPTTTSPLVSPNATSSSIQQQQHYHSHLGVDAATKSHSSDMLAHISPITPIIPIATTPTASINTLPTIAGNPVAYFATSTHTQQQGKTFDEVSISSLNSGETKSQKKQTTVKPKQWIESSLDGPIIRSTPTSEFVDQVAARSSHHNNLHKALGVHASHSPHHNHVHSKHKLSSQSMSVASSGISIGIGDGNSSHSSGNSTGTSRHYSMSKHGTSAHRQTMQDDSPRYAKLSQSTSYLHSLESANNDVHYQQHHQQQHNSPLAYQYLPPKPLSVAISATTSQPTPPPRPPPALDRSIASPVAPALVAAAVASTNCNSNSNANNNTIIGPDIRIESPKNMTVVQQATFQPYKEVTKPFEMADFYKYSTKFRQKENTTADSTTGSNTITDNGTE